MYSNISNHAKANEKDGTLSVLVECDNTEQLYIARLNMAYFIEEFLHRYSIDEDYINYEFNASYFDNYTDYKDTLDDIISDHKEDGKNEFQITLEPYREPKQIKLIDLDYKLNAKESSYYCLYGFVEKSDLGIDQEFIY